MPTPKPLTAQQAAGTLAHRFTARADRLRQLATKFGIRPYRCFLVWSKSDGREYGAGTQQEVARVEVLPTPKVRPNLMRTLLSGGVVPTGSVELTEVSAALTLDTLIGRTIPVSGEVSVPPPYDFHWELVEDGRGGDVPKAVLYKPFGEPAREPGNVQWKLTLAPISEDV